MQSSFTAKHSPNRPFQAGLGAFTALTLIICATPAVTGGVRGVGQSNAPSPFAEIAAKAGAQYQGDGLSVLPSPEGARLRCVFQKLEGQATPEGLWLVSTVDGAKGDRFRIVAASVGREDPSSAEAAEVTRLTSIFDFDSPGSSFESKPVHESQDRSAEFIPHPCDERTARRNEFRAPLQRRFTAAIPGRRLWSSPHVNFHSSGSKGLLPGTGTMVVVKNLARFVRPGLVEEYSVSVDGVRQDLLVLERPGGEGKLRVELDVAGAKAEPLVTGARLVLGGSGRNVVYSRLCVMDADGRELAARIEIVSANSLAVLLDDAGAVYPVRIDPTFSDANWVSMGAGLPGANDTVGAAVVDGAGNLYIGGNFTLAGETVANHVAKWDGRTWSALGSGLNSPDYAAVYALAISGTNLYVAGHFTMMGGSAATNIAKWNGSAWSALGSGLHSPDANAAVYALAVSGTNLYVGGRFTAAGGSAATNIAKWNGSTWSALGSGLNSPLYAEVYALAVLGTDLYVGGYFTSAGGYYIAKWDGSSWSAFGSSLGLDNEVLALAVSGADLYVGGSFTMAGGAPANGVAKWNGSAGSTFSSGLGGEPINQVAVRALAVLGTNLYLGGSFTTAGDSVANYVAKWDGNAWSALGSALALNNVVYAVAASGTNVYVGGQFLTADGSAANYIAQWNGSTWSSLGSGLNNPVYALAVSGTALYVGGSFTTAGGPAANYVAKWDGSAWSALGLEQGFRHGVFALAVSGTNLYVGGYFTTPGDTGPTRVAKWDGSAWSNFGTGLVGGDIRSPVRALAVSGSDLYVGGSFTSAGNSVANSIAKWNGSAWSALGSGLTGGDWPTVYALAIAGSDLYAGGYFDTAGGSAAIGLAKWDGSKWSALGSGLNGDVLALAVSGTELYASGRFSMAGGSPANYIAKWDGSAWSALGLGVNDGVWALAVTGTDLYVGGSFTTAGDKVSTYLARAILPPTLTIGRSGNNAVLSWASLSVGFALEQNLLLGTTNWTNLPATPSDDGTNKSVAIPLDSDASFFRLKK